MKKKNFITLIFVVIGVLVFGTGMCMCLLKEWNMFNTGVIVSAVGALVLILTAIISRKMNGKPLFPKIRLRTAGIIFYCAAAALVLGIGMCLVMVWSEMLWGIIVGVVGIIMILLLIPIIKGLK